MTILAPVLGLRGKGLSDIQVLDFDWQELAGGSVPDSLLFNFLAREQDFNYYLGVISSILYSFEGGRRTVVGNFQLGQVNNDGILAGFKDLRSLGLPMAVKLFYELHSRTGLAAEERFTHACVSGTVNENPDAGLRERGDVLMDTTDALAEKARAFARHARAEGLDPGKCSFLYCGTESEDAISRILAEEGCAAISVKKAATIPEALGHLYSVRRAEVRKARRRSPPPIIASALLALAAAAIALAVLLPRGGAREGAEASALSGPYWNDVPSLLRIWPQAGELAGKERLCPFLFPLERPEWLDARYLPAAPPRDIVLGIRFTADPNGNYGGWGVIFKGDPVSLGRFAAVRLRLKAKKGSRFEFKVKDDKGKESACVITVAADGWHEQTQKIPAGADMDRAANISLGFNDQLWSSDIRIGELSLVE
jgi:hypothetical protein